MKKVLLFVHFILIAVANIQAQSLNEEFEGNTFPPEGWEARCIPYPSLTIFPSWSQVASNQIDTNVIGFKGGKAALSTSAGGGFIASWTSSWLITPQITVGENEYLSFMLAASSGYNDLSTTKEPYKLKILISMAKNDSVSFTDTIFRITPKGILPWGKYYVDMSKYAGKKIYIAFWDFGQTPTNGVGAFVSNRIYVDNVVMTKETLSDIALSTLGGLTNGCQLEQELKLKVKNTGASSSSYKICYQINANAIIKQNVSQGLDSGEEKEYSFTEKLVFTSPRQNVDSTYAIKAWVESLNDANLYNDTLSTKVVIMGSMEYPYKMITKRGSKDFRSSTNPGRNIAYWKWFTTADGAEEECWLFSPYMTLSSMLASNCIVLPKGKVRVNFEYKCATNFEMKVSLGNFDYANYKEQATSDKLVSSPYEWVKVGVTIDVKELGKYSLGLTSSVTGNVQLLLRNIEICDPYNDVAVKSMTSPYANAKLKGSSVEVSAIIINMGKDDLQNIPVHYQLNDGTIKDGTISSLPSGNEIAYTFNDKVDLKDLGANKLKVWCTLAGDGDSGNDVITKDIQVYEAAAFPYKMGFESSEESLNWITYNPGKDNVYWDIMQVISSNVNYAKEGQYAAYINSFSGVTHDDWLISQAVNLPKGKLRLSFYYATLYSLGTSNLKVYLGKTDNHADFASGESVMTVPVDNYQYYKQGYVLLDVEEAGIYYLAFYNDGSGRDVILDDIRLDQADDLAASGISGSAKTGFYLTNSEVTFKVVNHGANVRSNIPVTYYVYKDGAKEPIQTVTETYSGTVEPGASFEYKFVKKADISTPGTYVFASEVKDAIDTDDYNNKITLSTAVVHYKAATVPYTGDLETDLERVQWTFGANWSTGNNFTFANSAYSGVSGIRHTSASAAGGDWVFSGCIEIPAGTYDFGFFFRTFLNGKTTSSNQNFEVFLGEAPNAESMTMSVYKAEDVLVPDRQYKKVVTPISISQNGHFYIGVKCTTTSTLSSVLFMDYFTITPPVTTGLSLEQTPYIANFAEKENEWYHYNPSSSHFEQWAIMKANNETYMKTKVSMDDKNMGFIYNPRPGAYVAPVMSLKKGDIIKATYDYSIIIEPTAPESTEQYLRLYMANKNMPDAFTTLVASGDDNSGDKATATGEITIPADGLYYFGYLIETPVSTKAFNLYTTKIEKTGTVGIHKTTAEDMGYYISGKTLYLNNTDMTVQIYDVSGQLVSSMVNVDRIGLDTYAPGIYIISLSNNSDTKTSKFVVK